MPFNRDPNKTSELDKRMVGIAIQRNCQIVNILCRNKDNTETLTFCAIAAYVPRIGETIMLQDEKRCRVVEVIHKVGTRTDEQGNAVYAHILPNVMVELIEDE